MSVRLERGSGSGPTLEQVTTIRFTNVEVVLRLGPGTAYSEEIWLRLWRETGTTPLRDPTLRASGLRPGIRQLWGTREAYEPPGLMNRYATTELGQLPVLLVETTSIGPGQIGPWIVLQWEAESDAPPGLVSPVTLTIEFADD